MRLCMGGCWNKPVWNS